MEYYTKIAVTLARLYGIAETLHPWEYLENEKFLLKIERWTDDFLKSDEQDVLQFFETKV
ncbi:MAG: hypothetical protein ACOX8M_10010 [Marvinbryantia sp.]|jgi:hypothetical protein